MNKPKTACNQPLLRRLTLLALPALIGGMIGCGPEQQVPEPLGVAKHEVRAPSETMTPALRAAYVANVQSTASHDYAVKTTGGVLKAHNAAQRFDVEMGDTVNVRLPGDERLSFELARVGCDGELRAAGKASPVAAGNRVEYVRRGGEAEDLTEWYVHGPLGLEQGFTLGRPLDCGAREVVIDVGLGGSLAPSIGAQGKAVLLRNSVGRAVARYSDLYVVDAAGRELPSKLEVVGRSVRIRFDERGAVYPVRVDPLVAVEQAKLLTSDGKAHDEVGYAVAIDGDTAVVGAPTIGAVYVFVRTGDTWTEQAKLETTLGLGLGVSVAVFEDTVAAGDLSDDQNGVNSGAVFVFTRSGTTWTEQANILADDGAAFDIFGSSTALSADTLVVGAPWHADGTGAGYVFTRTGDVWTQQAKLLPAYPQADSTEYLDYGDQLGESVALSGDTVIASASHHNGYWQDTGAAYVFVRNSGVWTEQAMLEASDASLADHFGRSVAISGDTAIIGSSADAYAFVRTSQDWAEQAKLSAQLPAALGGTAATTGDLAVSGEVHSGGVGSTYFFARVGSDWVTQGEILPSDPSGSSEFGTSLAMADNTLILGATGDADLGVEAGAAYIFVLRSTDGTPCADSSECRSGYCTDDVCCNMACDTACETCTEAAGATMDGTCTALTGPACDDGNACTLVDTCSAGQCVGTNRVACPPTDACHDNCDPATGLCAEIAKPDETPCDDGNACSQQDTCQAGVCVGSSTTSCTALDECHQAGACEPTTGACDNPEREDGAACSLGVCRSGECGPDGVDDGRRTTIGGCGCSVQSSSTSLPLVWLAFLTLAIALIGRRRDL